VSGPTERRGGRVNRPLNQLGGRVNRPLNQLGGRINRPPSCLCSPLPWQHVPMTALVRLARTRTDLSDVELNHLSSLVAEWSLIADLAMSDLVLWLPTWNEGGFLAGAHVRPATGPTTIPQDVVGTFLGKGRSRLLDHVSTTGRAVVHRTEELPLLPDQPEAVPVNFGGRAIAILERRASLGSRSIGRLEQTYLEAADDLMSMVARGDFPDAADVSETESPPRAGDGLVRLDDAGIVQFASPNALSAYHRLGLAVDLEGANLATISAKLVHRPGPVDEAVAIVTSGKVSGGAEVENTVATVTLRSLPLTRDGRSNGALVLVRDVTDLRRRERALLSKDATIREVHHRVKNNLQTVAALLRLQARRSTLPETRAALDEAVRRVAAIGIVHEMLANSVGGEEQVDFDSVTDQLLSLVMEYANPSGAPHLRREGTFGQIPGRVATPLSVVITELLHNAIEHGIAERSDGVVTLSGQVSGERLTVVVQDDGPGPEEDFVEGLGLQIVRTLVEDELRGQLSFESDNGLRAVIHVDLAGEAPAAQKEQDRG
jgi:two-component system, sensor histidine kinase PdtaS